MKQLIAIVLGLTSTLASAEGLDGVLSGVYRGAGHYADVTITPRGGEHLLSTCGYFGSVCLPITAVLRENGTGSYVSHAGTITAHYGNLTCTYSIRIYVQHEGDQIFLSHYGPGHFPNSSRGCPRESQLNYSDYVETEPYARVTGSSLGIISK